MKALKICVIGAGNISNSRHIPALKKNKDIVEIFGVIGNNKEKVNNTSQKNKIKNTFILDDELDISKQLEDVKWFADVDAVVIGTPPMTHYKLAKACLELGKNVLLEKPMTMNDNESRELIEIASKENKTLSVIHNFQYSNGIKKLEKKLKNNEFGSINTITGIQFTNRDRRLPEWYNELPLGLFYDEAAHFFYLLEKFGGDLKVLSATGQYDESKQENTPMILNIDIKAGKIPAHISMNFNSPVCEWYLILLCEKKVVIYDFFKDILIYANNDNQHLAKDILRNSLGYTWHFWKNFIANGFKLVTGNLHYGHDVVVREFVSIVNDNSYTSGIKEEKGQMVIKAMNQVIEKIENFR
ncbi:Gfo/Idh/MocA family protein [Sebaldella sp. S0638]|uniref:Gfo/Idh/MocA family protein n=1 Tax=Sebaldella sp. S0638 TaxID=2957809 RepID=UPI00209EE0E2|nr:Gfo/Idh/MocA family oxidoreductase [Sebaldella sp. S0638]MCP1223388.1 Gfo/Idh/MocA family oxidoreductase [Sebaldella sp. S0638]